MQVEIQGAYPGADVIRGKDWNLEDKDGNVSYVPYMYIIPTPYG